VLEASVKLDYAYRNIKSRTDVLANLPTRARWYLQIAGCGRTGNQTGLPIGVGSSRITRRSALSNPKFAVGEIILLRSQQYPECNGKYTVLEVRLGGDNHAITHLPFYGPHYKLDDDPNPDDHTWLESALRKLPDSDDDAFWRFMAKVIPLPDIALETTMARSVRPFMTLALGPPGWSQPQNSRAPRRPVRCSWNERPAVLPRAGLTSSRYANGSRWRPKYTHGRQ